LIVMSSVNGHGFSDGKRAVQALRRSGELAQVPIIIGGKLGIAGLSNRSQIGELIEAGFDAVFEDADGMAPLDAFLATVTAGSAQSCIEAS
jgi:methylaspartate mutase sigma subunit